MFTQALDQFCKQKGIPVQAVCADPGCSPAEFLAYFSGKGGCRWWMAVLAFPVVWLFSRSSYEGAQTTLHLCLAGFDQLQNGRCYYDCEPFEHANQGLIDRQAKHLWTVSQAWTHLNFTDL
jgi:hypothetical protein